MTAMAVRATVLAAGLFSLAGDATGQTDDQVFAFVPMPIVAAEFERAGLTDIQDRTADPRYPSIGARFGAFSVQATLYGCSAELGICNGLDLNAFMPSTSEANALKIEYSMDGAPIGFDASVREVGSLGGNYGEGEGLYVVTISHYIVYDYGISPGYFPGVLQALLERVDETRGFMLKDDPAHQALWDSMQDEPPLMK